MTVSRQAISASFLASILFSTPSLANTVTFECDYKTYSDEQGNHKVDKPFRMTFLIDSKAGKAYMIGNAGSSEVEMIPNAEGFTLVEVTGTGNVMVTVIADGGKSVHNRSGIILGDIVPSQYYGTCTQK